LSHQKFVFVAREMPDRALATIGCALRPLEFAIVQTLRDRLAPDLAEISFVGDVTVDDEWDGRRLKPWQWLAHFRDEVAEKVVVGVYRATRLAPPQVFYAHVDHADAAARVALADSVFHEQRGAPMLLSLAQQSCQAIYGGASLREIAEAAYAANEATRFTLPFTGPRRLPAGEV
jgi:hypothetical protein